MRDRFHYCPACKRVQVHVHEDGLYRCHFCGFGGIGANAAMVILVGSFVGVLLIIFLKGLFP